MKKLLAVMTLLLAMSAQASHWKDYGPKDFELTNKLMNLCPKELSKLFYGQGRTEITSASYIGNQTAQGVSTHWNVEVTSYTPAPFSGETKSHLSITEIITKIVWDGPAPEDHPGYDRKVSCKIR